MERNYLMKKRITTAKTIFSKMKTVLNKRSINFRTKLKIIETYIWSTLLYGCEC